MILNTFVIVTVLCGVTNSAAQPGLIFVTDKSIQSINLTEPALTFKVVDESDGAALDFLQDELVCWSNIRYENLQCKSRINNKRRVIHQNVEIPAGGLACDWYTRKLYWINNKKRLIGVSSIDEAHTKVLFWQKVPELRAIVVAPRRKLIFWIDWDRHVQIERASMDGDKSSRIIIATENLESPFGLTVDPENDLIYYSEAHYIASMDFDGENHRKIRTRIFPTILSSIDSTLFWINSQDQHIEASSLISPKTVRNIYHQQPVYDLKVWDAKKQVLEDNPCKVSNGNCSHLCLLSSVSSKGYSCACPTGIALLDEFRCAENYRSLLLMSLTAKIAKISLDTSDLTKIVIPLKGAQSPFDLDYDSVENKVYWTNVQASVIKRMNLDGSNQEDLISANSFGGIAVDWIGRNIFWVDPKNRRIEVSRLNGSRKKVVISSKSDHLRALVVVPTSGYIFWTDCDKIAPKIERANLDGTNRTVLVHDGLKQPTGLAVDFQSEKVFWCDPSTNTIEVVDFDGQDRKIIVKRNLGNSVSLAVSQNHIYWYNSKKRLIQRLNRSDGRVEVISKSRNLRRLKIVQPRTVPELKACANRNGGCAHFCFSLPRESYKCACEVGYDLQENGKSCLVADEFFVYSSQNTLGKISLSGDDEIIPTSSIQDVKSFDVDVARKLIYYVDQADNKSVISSIFINGTHHGMTVRSGLINVNCMTFDWIANNLYIVDQGSNKIEVVKLPNGEHRKTILWKDVKGARSLVLDPQRGVMYWIESRSNGTIFQSNMDGSEKKVLTINIGSVHDMVLDLKNNVLHWSSYSRPYIGSFDLTTNKKSTLVIDTVFPTSLTVYKDRLFWVEKNSFIETLHKPSLKKERFSSLSHTMTKLIAFDPLRQQGWNLCKVNNGNCSQLCFGNSSCGCESHFTMYRDNRTCIPPQQFLIYSQNDSIGRILPTSRDSPDVVLYEQDLSRARGLAYDSVKDHVYIISGQHSIVKSSNGIILDHVINDPSNYPFDLALDVVGRMLYWSCAINDTINVYQLDTSISIGVVIKSGQERPRHLAIHSEKRLLFWIDFGNPFGVKIIQSKVDGSGRLEVAKNLDAPTALAVDPASDSIFWAHSDRIESSTLYGDHRKILVYVEPYNTLFLSVFLDCIYWFNKVRSTIEKVEKNSASIKSTTFLSKNVTGFVAVKVPSDGVLENHVCSPFKDSECSHFCTGVNELACACPPFLNLANDQKTCEPLPDCGPDHFTCLISKTSGKECIPAQWRCDKHRDCSDGSDELGCHFCLDEEFRCSSGKCIDKKLICNGHPDCEDGLDEKNCCAKGDFKCSNSDVCVKPAQLCDKWDHCADGSDEKPPVCPADDLVLRPPNETDYNIEQYAICAAIVLMISLIFLWVVCSPGKYSSRVTRMKMRKILSWLVFWKRSPRPDDEPKDNSLNDNVVNEMNAIMMEKVSASYESERVETSDEDYSVDGTSSIPPNPPPSLASSSSLAKSNIRRRESHVRKQKYLNQPTPATPYNTCVESDEYNTESQYYKSDPDLIKSVHSTARSESFFSSSESHSDNLEPAIGYRAPYPSPNQFR